MLQDMPRCTAEDEFAQARPTVATHDQEVAVVLADLGEQLFAGLSPPIGLDMISHAVGPLTGECRADLGPGKIARGLWIVRFLDA